MLSSDGREKGGGVGDGLCVCAVVDGGLLVIAGGDLVFDGYSFDEKV